MEQKDTQNLPLTRKAQIVYLFKYFFSGISFAGQMAFLFALPLLVYSFFYISMLNSMLKTTDASQVVSFTLLYSLPIILGIIILGYGVVGAFSILFKISSDKVSHNRDFFTCIKENFKKITLIYFLLGLSLYFMIFNFIYQPFKDLDGLNSIFKVVSIIVFVYLLMITICASSLMVKYNLTIKEMLKSASLLTFAKFLHNALIIAMVLLPYLVGIFLSGGALIVYIAIVFLAYNGFALLLLTLSYQYVFDEIINKLKFPDHYRDGLKKYYK